MDGDPELPSTVAFGKRLARWQAWLETINQDITTVFLWRATWRAVGEMVRANSAVPPSHYFAYLANTYGTSQALALRRFADESQRVVSLATLIKDLKKHAPEITASWWVTLQPGMDRHDFSRFAKTGTDRFDESIAERDLGRLRAAVEPVKKYVNEHLAHRHRSPTKSIPTFAVIHAALDSVGEVFRLYDLLLTGADRIVMVPVPMPGWHLPFTVPWLPIGSTPPELEGTIRSLTHRSAGSA